MNPRYSYLVDKRNRLHIVDQNTQLANRNMKFKNVWRGYTSYGDIRAGLHGRFTKHWQELKEMKEITKEEAISMDQLPVMSLTNKLMER